MIELFFFLFVMAIVTVVGHGIWVFFAWIFGSAVAPKSSECPRCGTSITKDKNNCDVCHWPQDLSPTDRSKAIMWAIGKQLFRYRALGLLPPETAQLWLERLNPTQPTADTAAAPVVSSAKSTASIAEPPVVGPSIASRTIATDTEQLTGALESSLAATQEPVSQLVSPFADSPQAVPPEPTAPIPPLAREHLSIEERARHFAEQRALAAARDAEIVVATISTAPSSSPKPQREGFAKLFSAFLEEKNIRWGELVGGLLIVGCTIALVISFWSEINQRPLLKFLLLNGVTTAILGMGFYTQYSWKLRTTSLGLLLIGMLLIPLNFLAVAAFTSKSPPSDPVTLGGELISIVLFSALCWFASRQLVPAWSLAATIGTMVPSVWQLLTRRFIHESPSDLLFYGFALVPIAIYWASIGGPLISMRATPQWSERKSSRLQTLLGIVTLATLLPLAILVYQVNRGLTTFQTLAPIISLAGAPALAMGVLSWLKVTKKSLAWQRVIGVSIGLLATVVILLGVVLAWPMPTRLLPTTLLVTVICLVMTIRFRITSFHLPAGIFLTLAIAVVGQAVRGTVTWNNVDSIGLAKGLIAGETGMLLIGLSSLFAIASIVLARWHFLRDSAWQMRLTEVIAAVGFLIVSVAGLGRAGDPVHATFAYLFLTLGLTALARTTGRPLLAQIASAMLLLTLMQAIVFRYALTLQLQAPWIAALLAHATISSFYAIFDQPRSATPRTSTFPHWPASVALISSSVAAACIVVAICFVPWELAAIYTVWLALVWLVIAISTPLPMLLEGVQIAIAVATALGTIAVCARAPWYIASSAPWRHPWLWSFQASTWALQAVVWMSLRLLAVRYWPISSEDSPSLLATSRKWLASYEDRGEWKLDHLLSIASLVAIVSLSIYAVLPGTFQEISPIEVAMPVARDGLVPVAAKQFEIVGAPHTAASGYPATLLLVLTTTALVLGLWQRGISLRLCGLLLIMLAVALQLATRWENEVAVASALRWLTSLVVVAASVAIVLRDRIALKASQFGMQWSQELLTPAQFASLFRTILVVIALVPYVVTASYIASTAVDPTFVTSAMSNLLAMLGGLATIAAVIAIVLAGAYLTNNDDGLLKRASLPFAIGIATIGIAPIAIVWSFAIAKSLMIHPLLGPVSTSYFVTMGKGLSYGTPLLAIAGSLLAIGAYERKHSYVSASTHLASVVATMIYLMQRARTTSSLGIDTWIEVLQLNSAVLSLTAIAWIVIIAVYARRSFFRATEVLTNRVTTPALLTMQTLLASLLFLATLVPVAPNVVPLVPSWIGESGGVIGALLLIASLIAIWLVLQESFLAAVATVACTALLSIVVLISIAVATTDARSWMGGYSMQIGVIASGFFAISLHFLPEAWRQRIVTFSIAQRTQSTATKIDETATSWHPALVNWQSIALPLLSIGMTLFLTFTHENVAVIANPLGNTSVIVCLVACILQLGAIAWITEQRRYVWAMPPLVLLACYFVWRGASSMWKVDWLIWTIDTTQIFAIAGAAYTVICVFLERFRFTRPGSKAKPAAPLQLHHLLFLLSLCAVALRLAIQLQADYFDLNGSFNDIVAITSTSAILIASVCSLWQRGSTVVVLMIYFAGLLVTGEFVNQLNPSGQLFEFVSTLALAAFTLATGYIWSIRERARPMLIRLGFAFSPVTKHESGEVLDPNLSGQVWLVGATFFLSLVVILVSFVGQIGYRDFEWRVSSAHAILAQAIALALFAQGTIRTALQYISLSFSVLFAIALGFAFLPHDIVAPMLHRTVTAAVAISIMIPVLGLGLMKLMPRENEWTLATNRLLPALAVIASILFGVVLQIETSAFLHQGDPQILWPAIIAVALALTLLMTAAIAAAVLPGRDPFSLSLHGRTAYVYAAEVFLALLLLHFRVSMPWLFTGWLVAIWPLVTMGIAFVGIGAAELTRRKNILVLAIPLENTAALLPLLPVLGMWIVPSEVHGSLILIVVASVYVALAVLRSSPLFAILSILALQASWWFFLGTNQSLALWRHPQLWIIPPTLAVLIATHFARKKLTSQQLTTTRYLAATVLYASSCADIFLRGVAVAPWLPLVLAGLSIAGVFAGIILRIRAFLYLGTTFLVVAIFTMIWYAAVELERTWIWWVAGIVTGVLIITLFGLFEKKRNELLRIVDHLKKWDS